MSDGTESTFSRSILASEFVPVSTDMAIITGRDSVSFQNVQVEDNSESVRMFKLPQTHLFRSTIFPSKHSKADLFLPARTSEPTITGKLSNDEDMNNSHFSPFQPDAPTVKPHVCVWEHLSVEDMIVLNTLQCEKDDIINYLRTKFPERVMIDKKQEVKETEQTKSDEEEKESESHDNVLFELLHEVVRYSRLNKLDNRKTSALISIFFYAHQYFVASLWRSAEDLYFYFKEFMLLHTVLRPPKSAAIFEPEECRSALMHFCIIYLRYLPLIHLLEFPRYEYTISWEPKPEPQPQTDESQENVETSKGKDNTSTKVEKESKVNKKDKAKKLKGKGKKK